MTDNEYREFLTVLFRRYVRPRIPRLRRRFHNHWREDWGYHLAQAERAAHVLRYIEAFCDDDGDVYDTFTLDRLARAVSDTRDSLFFSNRAIDEGGFVDAYEPHASEILAGLQPQHLPEEDKEVLRDMGSPDPDAELAEIVFRAKAFRERAEQFSRQVSVRANCGARRSSWPRRRSTSMN